MKIDGQGLYYHINESSEQRTPRVHRTSRRTISSNPIEEIHTLNNPNKVTVQEQELSLIRGGHQTFHPYRVDAVRPVNGV